MRSDAEGRAQALVDAVFFNTGAIASCADAAKIAGINMATASRHWSSLAEEGRIEKHYSVPREHAPLKVRAIIAIVTEQSSFPDKYDTQHEMARYLKTKLMQQEGAGFGQRVRVDDSFVILGEFGNVGLVVTTQDDETLVSFAAEILARLPGVGNTKTVRLMDV